MRGYNCIAFVAAFTIITCIQQVFAGDAVSLRNDHKQFVVKLVNIVDSTRGTGFFIHDSIKGDYVVTNIHVVASKDTKIIRDSVLLFPTRLSKEGKAVSIDSAYTLYLRKNGKNLFFLSEDKDRDLILIFVGKVPTQKIDNPCCNFSSIGFNTRGFARREDFTSGRIRDGLEVQLLGFPSKIQTGREYVFTRFGNIALLPNAETSQRVVYGKDTIQLKADWMYLDIILRGGNSGGPILWANKPDSLKFIGFAVAANSSSEFGLALPSYYILDILLTINMNK